MPTPKASTVKDVAIHAEVTSVHVCALVAVQLAYGGYHVVSKVALQEGVNRYSENVHYLECMAAAVEHP